MKLENRTLYFGDNLDILREKIPDESIDLVYLDPPFNSKKNYNMIFENRDKDGNRAQEQAFEDTWVWNDNVQLEYESLINNKENIKISDLMEAFHKLMEENGTQAYLIKMTKRLIELHSVLKSTGSIYLHCDPSASHYLKIVMDTIFGEKNFRNEIVWSYNTRTMASNWFAHKHDIILFYTKTDEYNFNSDDVRIPHSKDSIKQYNKIDENGKKYKPQSNNGRTYLNENGQNCGSVWNIQILGSRDKERLGYPTQKPEALLERIIMASSNEGDTILDPFCGCGTTIAVAEKLKRNWIGIDIAPIAMTVIKNRMFGHYKDIQINLVGLPTDLNGAKMLAEKCGHNGRYDFQYWAVSLLNATPLYKKGKDYGIDGKIKYFELDENFKNISKEIIISVKSGKNIKSPEIRDLKGVIEREKASGGIYITLYEPTKDMLKEATVSGSFKYQNEDIPKIQICTIKDLLDKKFPKIPQSQEKMILKKAERKEVEKGKQKSLFAD